MIAVLSVLPPMSSSAGNDAEDTMMNGMQQEQQQIRLHVVLWAQAGMVPHETMHAFTAITNIPKSLALPWETQSIPMIREEVINRIACGLGGDLIAAEYILLNLLSRVELRSSEGEVVGHLPINLSKVTNEQVQQGFGRNLGNLLSGLVSRSQVLNLDLATLADAKAWIPSKDYETNILSTTPLQVRARLSHEH